MIEPGRRISTLPSSPITAVQQLIPEYRGSRKPLDLTQGAPGYPPPPAVRRYLNANADRPEMARYSDRAGIAHLRRSFASDLNKQYAATVDPSEVLITAGCNQAFAATIAALTDHGDEVLLPVPFYFDHDSWLRLSGVEPVYLPSPNGVSPDLERARTLLTPKTKAIVLVSPNNPTGATVPAETISRVADFAQQSGIVLILDETYRAFRSHFTAPHHLLASTKWDSYLVCLYSFSKEFAIPGFRVGAAVGHRDLIAAMAKATATMSVCPPTIGQEVAHVAITSAARWRRERANALAKRRDAFVALMSKRPGGFELVNAGSFFGWVRHPFTPADVDDVVSHLAKRLGIFALPGSAFLPQGGGTKFLRLGIGNLSNQEISDLVARLNGSGDVS